jgi:hypothetical protein
MADDSSLTLEQLNLEVEKIGSALRSMTVQIAGIRTRVADLEQWGLDGAHNSRQLLAVRKAKKRLKRGKKVVRKKIIRKRVKRPGKTAE